MSTVVTRFTVNGAQVELKVDARTSLADCLRRELKLTGTHLGCEHGVCGACTIIVDGAAVRSCLMLAAQADDSEIVTVEGLSNGEELSPLQASFRRHHALQCGFCTPGMVMAIVSLLKENPHPTEEQVRIGLEGNLCRCTGYHNIVRAALAAAEVPGEVPV